MKKGKELTVEEVKDLLSRLLSCWDEIHPSLVGQFPDSMQYNGKWYIGKWGSDTLQHMMDIISEG